jgi:3D-(3,5/4)-trihydroxycyclohexane-1,2-dione acylhydrolase (decyclizing)
MAWRAKGLSTFDCEFGYSCMGYEVAGGWGAKMADPARDVFVMVGDGSYLLMNSDIYSSVLTGMKLIVVVCDNGGFGVIDRLQTNTGIPSFNNLIEKGTRVQQAFRVDFAKHAEAMGALGIRVTGIGELEEALRRAKAADRTTVIHIDVHPTDWTGENDAWWECGTPEVSERASVRKAREAHEAGKRRQRIGV